MTAKTTAKLTRIASATVPRNAGSGRSDGILVEAEDGRVAIAHADSDPAAARDIGRRFTGRYSRALAALAK